MPGERVAHRRHKGVVSAGQCHWPGRRFEDCVEVRFDNLPNLGPNRDASTLQRLCPACDHPVEDTIAAGDAHHHDQDSPYPAGHYHLACCPACRPEGG